MSTDKLRVESNERVDIQDFQFLAKESVESSHRQLLSQFMTDPAKTRKWVVDGFEMSNPSAKQLRIEQGRAIAAFREGGSTYYGLLLTEGDGYKIVDLNTYGAGSYGIYVRFEFVEGDSESRIFWNPAGAGSEYTQTIPTRYLANWSVRVEASDPGSEWMRIGTVVQATMTITDQRQMYFEGDVHNSYASGWSSDGGGDANDRNSDRATYGISDFQTFTGAMRQCIEDIRGRGLRRWWERDIGGMNIGFDAAPVEDRLALGNANHYINYAAGPSVTWQWDVDDSFRYSSYQAIFKIAGSDRLSIGASTLAPLVTAYDLGSSTYRWRDLYLQDGAMVSWGTNDYLTFFESTNQFQFWADGVEKVRFEDTGVKLAGGLNVGVTYGTAIQAGTIRLYDAYVSIQASADDFFVKFDENDYLWYDREYDQLWLYVAASGKLEITDTEVWIADDLQVRGDMILSYSTGTGVLQFATNDKFTYERSTNILEFLIAGATEMQLKAGKMSLEGGLYVGTIDGTVSSGAIKADGHITTLDVLYGNGLNVNAGAPGYIDGHRIRASDYVQISNVIAEGADKGLFFRCTDGTANERYQRMYHTADAFIIAGEKDDGTLREHLTFTKDVEGMLDDLIFGCTMNAPVLRPSYDWDGIIGVSTERWGTIWAMNHYGNRMRLDYEGDSPYFDPYIEWRNENVTYNIGRFRAYGYGTTWRLISYMYDNDTWNEDAIVVYLDYGGSYKWEPSEILLNVLDWVTVPSFVAVAGQTGGGRAGYVVYTGYYTAPGGSTAKAVVGASSGNNAGWIKVYVDNSIFYIPYWSGY